MSEGAFNQDPLAFLAGGGEMGERIRAFDWSNTPLGPVESWSPALRTMLRILLVDCAAIEDLLQRSAAQKVS
jgi:hypothetical protein